MAAEVQTAQSSNPADKRAILSLIAGVTDNPPESHPGYDRVNAAYRALFRSASLRDMALMGDTDAVGECVSRQSTGGAIIDLSCEVNEKGQQLRRLRTDVI